MNNNAYDYSHLESTNVSFKYDPDMHLRSYSGKSNPAVRRAMTIISAVSIDTDMLQVLEVFRTRQQEHYFPVIDNSGRPQGLIRERSLKNYVYSRFGMSLLANRGQSRQLEQFLSPCPTVAIDAGINQVLQAAHAVPGTEGVLITAGGRYVGFIRASSLVEMAHDQQMETVRQHNVELDQKSREIQAVLQNMRQGICTILPNLCLHPDFSAHLSSILENDQLGGASLMESIFLHSDLGADALQQVNAALSAILEQDAFMFDCNAHLLPTEINVILNGQCKILELHWNPMLDENEEVSRLILVVRDITQMRELQQQAEQQRYELQLLSEILAASQSRFTGFMRSSQSQLSNCQQQMALELDQEAQASLYRQLHTIKGNARTLGLMAVTDSLHAAEQVLQTAREEQTAVNNLALEHALEQVEQDLGQYHSLYTERLQDFGRNDNCKQLDNQLWQRLQELAARSDDAELKLLLKQADSCSLARLLRELQSNLPALASELAKPEPALHISSNLEECLLTPKQSQQLADALVHILRNCLDHGIESAEQRLQLAKPAAGTIHAEGSIKNGMLQLLIGDDGRGLALEHLHRKAINCGLLNNDEPVSDEQIAQTIFHSGQSTAGTVSMVSGRGVGMDAVRNGLKEMGGNIQINWNGPRNAEGYRPFSLSLVLPMQG